MSNQVPPLNFSREDNRQAIDPLQKVPLIDRFKNGRERFHKDPIFHSVLTQLEMGADPLSAIEMLLNVIE